ncbi:aminoglycoside N(3)-acetyltransferase [Streptomyces sp. NPDC060027]|uniref:aminoglycoside N(3)-acetyltransferase n=1 Tax=Streptomyces sp. NPDC060027 TaxID=3347040 RepID=UPI0036CC67FC
MRAISAIDGLTEPAITRRLAELGVEEGDILLVHASLSSFGRVAGGAASVLGALGRVLGTRGTLVVPTFTSGNSDTSSVYRDRIHGLSDRERAALRNTMPPFDPETTPSTGMGVLAETVRCDARSVRSGHPQTSFAARGPQAARITDNHHPDCHLGEHSPLARLYELRARVLLLGVGFDRCTAFHLGEYRVPDPPRRTYRCVVRRNGLRQWWSYDDVALDDSDFGRLGADFERAAAGEHVRSSLIGAAHCRLLSLVDSVDYARHWLPSHRVTAEQRPADS